MSFDERTLRGQLRKALASLDPATLTDDDLTDYRIVEPLLVIVKSANEINHYSRQNKQRTEGPCPSTSGTEKS